MRIAIVGSRSLKVDISEYIPECVTEIISGGAKGIDTLASIYANANNIPICVIRPEYNRYGKTAPLIRNEVIVDISDLIIAIWDGKSHGTKYVIDYAKKVGKPIKVYFVS